MDSSPESEQHDDFNADDLGGEPAEGEFADQDDFDGFSLDDLGAAYARAAAEHDPERFAAPEPPPGEAASADEATEPETPELADDQDDVVHPEGIVEAALFVGHPENQPL